jgi:hypothetical protein
MKKVLFAAVFALCTQAFAIIGVGAHYVHNTGTLKGANEVLDVQIAGQTATLNRSEVSGLKGLGFKLWIDFLPFVDIEGTFNVSAVRYVPSLSLEIAGVEKTIDFKYSPEAPYNLVFSEASPIYGLFSGDVSITYPITFLPVARPYAGLGVSYMASMPLVDKKFVGNMAPALTTIIIESGGGSEIDKTISDELSKALKKADYKTGIGGHAIVGSRFKLPVIPIAAYTNVKYYFGGGLDDKFSQGVVLELGGGLAI